MTAETRQHTLGLRALAYHFDECVPIEEIPLLQEKPRLLAEFRALGHERVAISHGSLAEQAILSARKTLEQARLSPADIDAVVIGHSEMPDWDNFPEMLGTIILQGLGLTDLPVVGVTLAGCANYSSCVRVARNMLVAEGLTNILVIETNQVRGKMQRAFVTRLSKTAGAIFGDAAVSFLVTAGDADFRVLGMAQTVLPIEVIRVQIPELMQNTTAGYRSVVTQAMKQAGVSVPDLHKIMLSNVGVPMQAAVAAMIDVPFSLLYVDNVKRTGHMWSADNLVNLADYCSATPAPAGALFLLVCQADSYFSAIVCSKT